MKQVKENPKRRRMTIKFSEEEYSRIRYLAKKFANGNVNGWLRYCGSNYRPEIDELETIEVQAGFYCVKKLRSR